MREDAPSLSPAPSPAPGDAVEGEVGAPRRHLGGHSGIRVSLVPPDPAGICPPRVLREGAGGEGELPPQGFSCRQPPRVAATVARAAPSDRLQTHIPIPVQSHLPD